MTDKTEPKYIHLVVLGVDYQGYDYPEAAFFSEQAAEAFAAKLNRKNKSKSFEVVSVEIKDGL